MKLLFLTTQFPYPLDNGGKIGALNGISVVTELFDTTVVSFCETPEIIDEGINYLKKIYPKVNFIKPILHWIHIRKKPLKLLKTMIYSYIKKVPYVSAKFENEQMYNLIDLLFENRKWDIVFIDYLNMARYGEYIRRKYNSDSIFIFKDHNIEFEIVKQAAKSNKGIKRLVLENEWKRTKKYEEYVVKHSDLVFSVCEDNTKILKSLNRETYTMLPTFAILPWHKPLSMNNKLLYIGNLSWEANKDGLEWFVNKVLPIVVKYIPEAILTVAGSGCNDNPFVNNPYVNFEGYVENLDELYDTHQIFIVPLFEGSGIRIKILDAFNHNIPVVSTRLGCETIGAVNEREILIADTEDAFAESIICLLLDKERSSKQTYNAKKLVERKYGIKSRIIECEKIVTSIIKDKFYGG